MRSSQHLAVEVDEELLRALDAAAERSGRSRSELVEEAVARQVATEALERIWAHRSGSPLSEDDATELAYDELRAVRRERRASGAAS